MMFETDDQKRTISRWLKLAIQLNGAIDTGKYDEVTTEVVAQEIRAGTLFDVLREKLPTDVWTISKLTDVDRHTLLNMWRHMSEAFEPYQFHVRRNGLALLVAYILHAIDIQHAVIPR